LPLRLLLEELMSILVKNGSSKWEKASEEPFSNEVELQELLYASPELIEREDDGQIVFTRESSLPGSGSTDLIGVASNGDILLVETKLAKNTEIRRKVIGQILEYAAFLWRMSYHDFDQFFLIGEGKSLVELLTARGAEIDEENFRATVSENLKEGHFDLLIAVDEMNKELETIISYISNFDGGLKLEALAVKVHRHNQTAMLVPQRFRGLSRPGGHSRSASRVTVDEVLTGAPDEHTRELLGVTLLDWQALGHVAAPGSSGFSCKAEIGEKLQPLFWVIPEGGVWCIEPLFGSLVRRGARESDAEEYRKAVSQIKGFPGNRCLTGPRPPAKLANLTAESVRTFLKITSEFIQKWRTVQV